MQAIEPSKMNWFSDGFAHYRGSTYYIKLESTADWLKALRAIRASVPDTYPTEIDAHTAWRNMEVLYEQIQIFTFNPIEGDTVISRSFGIDYPDDDPDNALRISGDDYRALARAHSQLAKARSDALIRSLERWRPTLVETVMDVHGIATNRLIAEKAPREKLIEMLCETYQMLWQLTCIERKRLFIEHNTAHDAQPIH